MLYGVYCTQEAAAAATVLHGALGFADFTTRTYMAGATVLTDASIVDDPSKIDNGLNIDWNLPNSVRYLTGDLLAIALAADWTMVFEFAMAEDADMQLFGMMKTGQPDADIFSIDSKTSEPSGLNNVDILDSVASDGSTREPTPDAPTYATSATRRIALTRTIDRVSGSVNGLAVGTDTAFAPTAYPASDVVVLGQDFWPTDPDQYAYMNGSIKRIIFYPAIADADLVALSTGDVQYPGSPAAANFFASAYRVAGADVAVATMIDHPEFIGEFGLTMQWDTNPGSTYPLGSFLSALLATEVTVVVEIVETDTGSMFPLWMGSTNPRWIESADDHVVFFDYDGNRICQEDIVPARPAIRRIAITTTANHASISVNGRPVITDSTAGTPPSGGQAVIGGNTFDGWANMVGYIRAIEVWPAQNDRVLPFMSAL